MCLERFIQMSYRCIYIRRADKMNLRDNNIVVRNDEREVIVPLEDIAMILLEDNCSLLTAKLISSLSSYYIGLIICDDKYMPVSLTLPLHMHYKQLRVFHMQLDVKKPFNSQLWFRIVKQKIINQRRVIEMTTKDEYAIDRLLECEKELKSNDKTNREALAAKYFFSGLYGSLFIRKRKSEDEINAALNYGYTILMANMSRILAMYGFNTIIGIHHISESNNFNLSCDLMEPFRPIIDLVIYQNINNLSYPLTKDIKKELIEALTKPVRINNKNYLIQYAMEEMVLSYIKALENENSEHLLLPSLLDEENVSVGDDIL